MKLNELYDDYSSEEEVLKNLNNQTFQEQFTSAVEGGYSMNPPEHKGMSWYEQEVKPTVDVVTDSFARNAAYTAGIPGDIMDFLNNIAAEQTSTITGIKHEPARSGINSEDLKNELKSMGLLQDTEDNIALDTATSFATPGKLASAGVAGIIGGGKFLKNALKLDEPTINWLETQAKKLDPQTFFEKTKKKFGYGMELHPEGLQVVIPDDQFGWRVANHFRALDKDTLASGKWSESVVHPEMDKLLQAYPELKKELTVSTIEPEIGTDAQIRLFPSINSGDIRVRDTVADPESALLHETQHFIDMLEGRAAGSSVAVEDAPYISNFRDSFDSEYIDKIKDKIPADEVNRTRLYAQKYYDNLENVDQFTKSNSEALETAHQFYTDVKNKLQEKGVDIYLPIIYILDVPIVDAIQDQLNNPIVNKGFNAPPLTGILLKTATEWSASGKADRLTALPIASRLAELNKQKNDAKKNLENIIKSNYHTAVSKYYKDAGEVRARAVQRQYESGNYGRPSTTEKYIPIEKQEGFIINENTNNR